MRVSVVVPVADEGTVLARVIEEIYSITPPALLGEVIVVDDASTDDTPAVMRTLISNPRLRGLRYLRHRIRAGRSFAVHTGAFAARNKIIVTFDGDGQNDPADIERLAHRIAPVDAAGPALVCGVRTRRRAPRWRVLLAATGNWIRSLVLRDRCRDTGCGIRAMERGVYLRMPVFRRQDVYLPALFKASGLPVVELAVNDRARMSGRSKHSSLRGLASAIPDLAAVLWLTRSKPVELTEIWPDGGVEVEPARVDETAL